MSSTPPAEPLETEEELRERCLDMTMDELVEAIVEKHHKLDRSDKTRQDLFMAKASKEAAERKVQSLEGENHTLLSRAMQSEEQVVKLTAEVESLRLGSSNAAQSAADAQELKKLKEEIEGLRDAKSLVEAERQKAAEHNELRLSVEHAFNELSRQHEDLLKQLEAAQAEAKLLRDRQSTDEAKIQQLTEDRGHLKGELAVSKSQTADAEQREAHLKEQLEEMRRTAEKWKKEAGQATALQAKCNSLTQTNEKQNHSIKELQAALRQAHLEAQQFEEERRRWIEEQKRVKHDKFLKQQLAELQYKMSTQADKEKGWVKERAELQAKIKKLMNDLARKNPSQLRLMELEVQNELLLGMLSASSGNISVGNPTKNKRLAERAKAQGKPPLGGGVGKGHFGGSDVLAPKVLPPLDKSPSTASATTPSDDDAM